MWGLTEQQVSSFGLTFGIAGFMLYMLFIVAKLARDSHAGKVGTVVLFLVLGLGMIGFVAKTLIEWLIDV